MPDLTSLANVKQYLDITTSGSDALLSRLITAQSQWFRNAVQRQITRQTYVETFNGQDERVATKSYMSPWVAGALYGGFFVGARGFAICLPQTPVVAINYVYIDGGDGNGNIGVSVPQATNLGQTTQTDGWVLHSDPGQVELIGYRFTVGVNNCSISYDAGFSTTDAVNVPSTPYQYQVPVPFVADRGVIFTGGAALAKVASNPGAGQYAVSPSGLYTFAAADTGKPVSVSYDFTPSDVEQAVIELVAWRFKERGHIGQSSRGVGGEQVSFSPYAAPQSVQAVIDNYRQVRV